jgi:DNA-binding winged helix-turn-helix (wHTH) protein
LRGGRPVALTPKAIDVLYHLASRPDRLVTKEELLASVWPDVVVSDASVKVCVREIRKALEDDADQPRFIETVHRKGYRFIAPVEGLNAPHMDAAGRATPAPAAKPSEESSAESPERHRVVGRERELEQLAHVLDRARTERGKCCSSRAVRVREKRRSSTRSFAPHGAQTAGRSSPSDTASNNSVRASRTCPCGKRSADWRGRAGRPKLNGCFMHRNCLRRRSAPRPPSPRRLTAMPRPDLSTGIFVIWPTDWNPSPANAACSCWSSKTCTGPTIRHSTSSPPSRGGGARAGTRAGTYRPEEAMVGEHPLRAIAADLLSRRLAVELPMSNLDESAVERYVSQRLGGRTLPTALTPKLHDRTGGNPLFLVSLVEDLIEQGVLREGTSDDESAARNPEFDALWVDALEGTIPHGVREMIVAQFDRLTPAEQRVLEAGAVAGVEFSAAGAAGALGDDVVAIEHACDDLAVATASSSAAATPSGPTRRSPTGSASATTCSTMPFTPASPPPNARACTRPWVCAWKRRGAIAPARSLRNSRFTSSAAATGPAPFVTCAAPPTPPRGSTRIAKPSTTSAARTRR